MKEYLNIIIPASVTIIGFMVTYYLTKRNFKEEISKQKISILLGEMSMVPMEILGLMDKILDKKDSKIILSDFKSLMARIFAYGTKDAIALVSNMQELNYRIASDPETADKSKIIAYYILLVCQIKYDLTGIKINPEYWYKMRLTDYINMRVNLVNANNEVVKNLKLERFLDIK